MRERSGDGSTVANRDRDAAYVFLVEGLQQQRTALPTHPRPVAETYEVDGEHVAEALRKLLSEIEWGILDDERGFTITFVPNEADDA